MIDTCLRLINKIKKFQSTNDKSTGGGVKKLAIIPIPKDKHRTTLMNNTFSVINEINVKNIENCLANLSDLCNSIGTMSKGIISGFKSDIKTMSSMMLKLPNRIVKTTSTYFVFK